MPRPPLVRLLTHLTHAHFIRIKIAPVTHSCSPLLNGRQHLQLLPSSHQFYDHPPCGTPPKPSAELTFRGDRRSARSLTRVEICNDQVFCRVVRGRGGQTRRHDSLGVVFENVEVRSSSLSRLTEFRRGSLCIDKVAVAGHGSVTPGVTNVNPT